MSGVAVLVGAALPAGAAQAHDVGSVRATVVPASAAPGATVQVSVSGCESTTGSAGAGAFEGEAELTRRDGGGTDSLNGSARIRNGVTGSYELTVICDGHPHQGVGTVRVNPRKPEKSTSPSQTGEPTSPVRAGGGGTAKFTSVASAEAGDADEAGPGTRHAVVGLVLAGVAAVAVAFRSARRRRSD
ncbi:hypothetical protein [Streptomyces sp. NPDC003032]